MARFANQGLLLLLLVAVIATAFGERFFHDAEDAPASYSSWRSSSEPVDIDWGFDYEADKQDDFESNLDYSSYERTAPSEEDADYNFDEDDSDAEWSDEYDNWAADDEHGEDDYDGGLQRANSDPGNRPRGSGKLKRRSSMPEAKRPQQKRPKKRSSSTSEAEGPQKRPKPTAAPPNSPFVTRKRAGHVKGRPVPSRTAQPAKGILRQPGTPSTNQGNVIFASHTKDTKVTPGGKFARERAKSKSSFNPNNPDGSPKDPEQIQKEQETMLRRKKGEEIALNINPRMRTEEHRRGWGPDPIKVTKDLPGGFPIGPKAAQLEGKRLESELAKEKQRPQQWQAEAGGERGTQSMGKKLKPKPAPKPTRQGKTEPVPLTKSKSTKSKSMFGRRKRGIEEDDKNKRKQDKA